MPSTLGYFGPTVFLDSTTSAIKKGASILVYKTDATTLASHYTDQTGAGASTSAFLTDSVTGVCTFWAEADKAYHIKVDGAWHVDSSTNKTVFRVTPPGPGVWHASTFGAVVGGSAAVNKPAFIAAEAAIHASPNGGTMHTPEGTCDVGDWAGIRLPYAGGRVHNWEGEGLGSILHRSIDGSVDTEFVDAVAGIIGSDRVESTIRNIHFKGPGSGLTYGTAPAVMNGLAAHNRMRFENVKASGWKAGWVVRGNHVRWLHCDSTYNGYGWYWNRGLSHSDFIFDDCFGDANSGAAFAVAPGALNFMGGTKVLKGHYGVCPYIVYLETGSGTIPNGGTSMANVMFDQVSFEQIGNAFIYSEGQTGTLTGITIRQCRPFSINNALFGLPSSSAQYMIHVDLIGGSFGGLTIDDTTISGFGSVPTVTYINALRIASPTRWSSWLDAFTAAGTTTALICCPSINGGIYLYDGGQNVSGYTGIRVARAFGASGTVQAGDVVGHQAAGANVIRPTAYGFIAGVALNTPAETSELVIVAQDADAVPVKTSSSVWNINHIGEQDAATFYKMAAINQSAAVATRPRIGKASFADADTTDGIVVGRVRVGA